MLRGLLRESNQSRRASRSMLALALALSVFASAAGSAVIWKIWTWGLQERSPEAVSVVDDSSPLRLGIARTPGGPAEWITLAKVFAQMQRNLDRRIVVNYGLSSEDQITMLRRGELDVALMSTLAYLDMENTGEIEAVATAIIGDQPLDAAVVVVPYDSAAEDILDLRGGRFAVSPDLAGSAYAYWLLEQAGEDPRGFFSETMSGVQDENLTRVENGRADATSVRASALSHWPERTFRIIERSPDLGMPPIVVSTSLDDETIELVRRSLLDAQEDRILPANSVITGFRSPADTDYDFARELDGIQRHLEIEAFGSAHQ